MAENVKSKLATFEAHGFVEEEEVGEDNVRGVCPFCGKSKFYVNQATGQWDCKSGSCGRTGNLLTFLAQVVEFYSDFAEETDWQQLEQNRGLSLAVLQGSGIVWNGTEWLLPVRTVRGTVQDLRRFRFGDGQPKLLSTKGCNVGLFGAEGLSAEVGMVYVCEGEWDCLAMREMIAKESNEKTPCACVGVPGAGTWKDEWSELLRGKRVFLAYDHDKAGHEGMRKVARKLAGVARSVKGIEWPETTPKGFDLRDAYRMETTAQELLELFQHDHEGVGPAVTQEATTCRCGSFVDLLAYFHKWLAMSEDLEWGLRIICSTVLSVQIPGDPLWVYIVAPPGGTKTELLVTVSQHPQCVIRSTVTAHSLVSGWQIQGGKDPSLLPLLDGKTFILKDFTEIWALPKVARDEIYAIFRGAYDGMVEKTFGNGVHRKYNVHFSMLAGATQQLHADRQASLGERFLKFRMASDGDQADHAVRMALSNVSSENVMRAELAAACASFLNHASARMNSGECESEELPDWFTERLVSLAQLLALLRGEVERDMRSDRLLYMPQHEIGTRVAKQLKKLALALSLLEAGEVDWQLAWKIVRRVALDSCIGFSRTLCGCLQRAGKGMNAADLAVSTGIPLTTVRAHLEDMELLGALRRQQVVSTTVGRPMFLWELSEEFWELAEGAGVEALNDPVLVKKRRKP